MDFSYAIDPERQMIFVSYRGRFTLARLLESVRVLWADPAYRRDYAGLVDASDGSASVAIADLHALIAFMRERPELSSGRWAAIATTPFATACGLLYQRAVAAHHRFEVFSSREAAEDFLRLEGGPPPLRPCPLG